VSSARRLCLPRPFAAIAAILSQNVFLKYNRQEIWPTLVCVRALNKKDFILKDVYAFAAQLQVLHPDNRHVLDKIRQQLQVLRDLGFVEFLGGGRYRCV
jgi:type II restriction enzyme